MPTLKDVAREANVAPITVSRVVSGNGYVKPETAARVQQAIRRLGYTPNRAASSLVTGRTLSIGMVVPDVSYPFFTDIVLGAEVVASEHGYNLILCNTAENLARELTILNFLREARVDGVIMCSPRSEDTVLLPALALHRAFVLVNHPGLGALGGCVRSNHLQGATLAVQHLIANARKHIAFMCGPERIPTAQERSRGYVHALKNANYPVDPSLIVPYTANLPAGMTSQGEWLQSVPAGSLEWNRIRSTLGSLGARALLTARPDVDGIICYSDQIAVGALQACQDLGRRVPEDVALVGSNDLPIASQVTPALTTLRIPTYEMGASAARLLLERLADRAPQNEIVLPHELIVRASAP